jgi:hypothetical protein
MVKPADPLLSKGGEAEFQTDERKRTVRFRVVAGREGGSCPQSFKNSVTIALNSWGACSNIQ